MPRAANRATSVHRLRPHLPPGGLDQRGSGRLRQTRQRPWSPVGASIHVEPVEHLVHVLRRADPAVRGEAEIHRDRRRVGDDVARHAAVDADPGDLSRYTHRSISTLRAPYADSRSRTAPSL